MTLTFFDDSIHSILSRHTAYLAPGHEGAWQVSWLPGRLLDRNSAITAMLIADAADDVHPGHPYWRFIEGWAAELGLSTSDALAWASQPPGRASGKEAVVPEDPEAAGV